MQTCGKDNRCDYELGHTGPHYCIFDGKHWPERRPLLLHSDDPTSPEKTLFLPLGKTGMLAGPGGAGKTQALVSLAVAVASGRPWLGTYGVADGPGAVLLALGEEDEDEYRRRLHECVQGMELAGDSSAMEAVKANVYPRPLCGKPAQMVQTAADGTTITTPFTNDLIERLKSAGVEWKLIVLDPASRFMGADAEKDNAAATRWIECLERITLEVPGRPTVLFGHHTNKGALSGETDQGAARGSSALTDGVRWQANMELVLADNSNAKNKRTLPLRATLRVVKSNYGPKPAALELVRDPHCGGFLRPAGADVLQQEEEVRARGAHAFK